MSKFLYDNLVGRVAKNFDAALSEIEAEYNFDYGNEFEIALCKTLRQVLPHKYGICRGFVVNEQGDCAGDDIIIYERIRFPTFRFLEEDYSRKEKVPIDAVFAYIEAKHTLQLKGESGTSLSKAISQAKKVKLLCEQRNPVPITKISQGVNLGEGFSIGKRLGFFEKKNPMYTMIMSRQVRLEKESPVLEDANTIHSTLTSKDLCLDIKALPDLVVAGRSHVIMPYLNKGNGKKQICSPFYDESECGQAVFSVEQIAFGVAVAHLLWALDSIELGSMPWSKVLADSMNLKLI